MSTRWPSPLPHTADAGTEAAGPGAPTCCLVSRRQAVVLVLKSAALRGEPALGALLGAHGGRWLWWGQVSQKLTRAPHGVLGELI